MIRNATLRATLLVTLVGCIQPGEVPPNDGKVPDDVLVALQRLPRAEVVSTSPSGMPQFVRGELWNGSSRIDLAAAAQELAPALDDIAPVFRLTRGDLALRSVTADPDGTLHARYQQRKDGMDVVGGDLVIHVDAAGTVYAVNGAAYGDDQLDPSPDLDASHAMTAARAVAPTGATVTSPRLLYVIGTEDQALHLAWQTTVEGTRDGDPVLDLVFVDAHSGAVVARHPQIHHARNRRVYSAGGGTSLPGTLRISEGGAAVSDSVVMNAYHNTGITYDFYKTVFNRDSYNGTGGNLTSTVHYSTNYNNAFWTGSQMVYGDGDGSTMGPLANSLDVTAHELTHGVTQYTAGLVYENQPGAINEAMSDILGACAEQWSDGAISADTWKLGEDIWTPGTPGDAMRYMDDPVADGYSRDYYPNRYTGTSDNGGVHINSGIANLAFKLLVTGGTHPRGRTTTNVSAQGIDKARRIFYRALTTYMTSTTNFQGARAATAQAAADLYDPATVAAVHAAWTAVGVPGDPGGGGGSDGGGGSGTVEPLSNGTPVAIAGASGTQRTFSFQVPSGATSLSFTMSGGTGDADLYVKYGAIPTKSSYDYRPYLNGNNETVAPATATAGTWYILVDAYATYSGASLVAQYQTGGGTPPPPGDGGTVSLSNGVPVTGLSASSGQQKQFSLVVPAGATNLRFAMSGGTGDADLYVKFGTAPTTTSWDYRPYKNGNAETVVATTATQGTWYVMIHAYAAYSGVQLVASYDAGGGGGGTTLANGVQVDGLSGAAGAELRYTFVVPSGATSLSFAIGNGTGDADLYVRYGAPPTTSTWDYRPYLDGNAEGVSATPTAGTWHVMVRGYTAFNGLSILAQHQ